MKTYLLLFAALLFVGVTVHAQFINGQAADTVLGQANFTTGALSSPSQSNLDGPQSVAIDTTTGKIFVADASAYRVLRWPQNPAIGLNAEAVIGQPDFVSGNPPITLTSSNIDFPAGVVADGAGRLWVVDNLASRVLRFDGASTITSGSAANGVLGQSDFTTGGSSTTSSTLSSPYGAAIDASGNLFVADQSNNRVLLFKNAAAKSNGAVADGVLGQPDFTHNVGGTTASLMSGPTGVAVDLGGTLYVLDAGNNRVLRFASAATKSNGAAADGVIGQTGFTGFAAGTTRSTLRLSTYYGGIAVDGAGRLYISDQNNNRILYFITPDTITIGTHDADGVLGQSSFTTRTTPITDGGLNGPTGLVVDNANGRLWVADAGNNRVLSYLSSIVPLPVELTSFTASELSGKVELAWATATEINNYGFDIERNSVNSEQSTVSDWAKVGFVAGHGTTNAPQSYTYTDASVRVGKYSYRLKQIDHDGNFVYGQTIEATVGLTPGTVFLDNNYPNPFNPSTKISFVLGTTGRATLKVFNLLGQEVATLADGEFNGGDTQTFTFDASKLSSGIYYYQLKSGTTNQIKKMMLLK